MNRRLVLGVTKCSFGMDYMKHYACRDAESAMDKEKRLVGLMGYDTNGTGSLRSPQKKSSPQDPYNRPKDWPASYEKF